MASVALDSNWELHGRIIVLVIDTLLQDRKGALQVVQVEPGEHLLIEHSTS
jgi:hypothetical protein